MALNTALKMAMFEREITQIEVATRAGIHESRMSKIARGHIAPSDEEKRAIAKVLRKTVDELFSVAA